MISHILINDEVVIDIDGYEFTFKNDSRIDWNKFCRFLNKKGCNLDSFKTEIGKRKLAEHWLLDFKIKERIGR